MGPIEYYSIEVQHTDKQIKNRSDRADIDILLHIDILGEAIVQQNTPTLFKGKKNAIS